MSEDFPDFFFDFFPVFSALAFLPGFLPEPLSVSASPVISDFVAEPRSDSADAFAASVSLTPPSEDVASSVPELAWSGRAASSEAPASAACSGATTRTESPPSWPRARAIFATEDDGAAPAAYSTDSTASNTVRACFWVRSSRVSSTSHSDHSRVTRPRSSRALTASRHSSAY